MAVHFFIGHKIMGKPGGRFDFRQNARAGAIRDASRIPGIFHHACVLARIRSVVMESSPCDYPGGFVTSGNGSDRGGSGGVSGGGSISTFIFSVLVVGMVAFRLLAWSTRWRICDLLMQ